MIVHFPKFHEVSVFIIHTKTFLLTPESDYEIYVRPQVKPKKKELERVGRSNNIALEHFGLILLPRRWSEHFTPCTHPLSQSGNDSDFFLKKKQIQKSLRHSGPARPP